MPADRPQRTAASPSPLERALDRVGDAFLLEGLEPSAPLDAYLNELELAGRAVPDRAALVRQVGELLRSLGQAKLGHRDLHLGNLLLHDRTLYLLDAYAVRRGGLRAADVMLLAVGASRYASRADLIRVWRALGTRAGGEVANVE